MAFGKMKMMKDELNDLFPLILKFSLNEESKNDDFNIPSIVELIGIRTNECLLSIKNIIIEGNIACIESLSIYTFCQIYYKLSSKNVIFHCNVIDNIFSVKIKFIQCSSFKKLYERHEIIDAFIICKENNVYLSYLERNNKNNGSGSEFVAKFINSKHIKNINIINNINNKFNKNEIYIQLSSPPIIFKYFNQFKSGIKWICSNCLFINECIFNRCNCCDKKRKTKLNYNKEKFWEQLINSTSPPNDDKQLIWKNCQSMNKFIKYQKTGNFICLLNENGQIFEYQFDFKDLSDGFYSSLSQSIYFFSICCDLILSFNDNKNNNKILTKCIKLLNKNKKIKIKQKIVSMIKNSNKKKNENCRRLKSILRYFTRMQSYYPFLAFLYHYTKYRYSWVIEEIDDNFTLKLDQIEEEIVTPQYLTQLIIKIKYPSIKCIENYFQSTNDQFDESKSLPLFCLQCTEMRNQIIINQHQVSFFSSSVFFIFVDWLHDIININRIHIKDKEILKF